MKTYLDRDGDEGVETAVRPNVHNMLSGTAVKRKVYGYYNGDNVSAI